MIRGARRADDVHDDIVGCVGGLGRLRRSLSAFLFAIELRGPVWRTMRIMTKEHWLVGNCGY